MSLFFPRLPQAWTWGGLSFKELAVRTYEAVDKHEIIDRAAIVAFYAFLALVPFLGLVLTFSLGASDGVVARQILNLSRQFLPAAADEIVRGEVPPSLSWNPPTPPTASVMAGPGGNGGCWPSCSRWSNRSCWSARHS
jgi:hypothetical protein